MKIIKGKNYYLSQFSIKDINDEYLSWLNEPEVNKFLEIRFKKQSKNLAIKYINSFYSTEEKYIWGIYCYNSNKLVGTINLWNLNRNHGFAEISLMIGDRSHWGKTAAEESLRLAINFAFFKKKLRRITASSYSLNLGINFTLKKLGFKLEGKLRKNRVFTKNKYDDEYKWGVLLDEWKK